MLITPFRKQAISICLVVFSCLASNGQQNPQRPPRSDRPKVLDPGPPSVEQDDIIRITTNLVQIDAVVTKGNKQITDLTAEDFEVFEDGKRQTITNFSYVLNAPLAAKVEPGPVSKDKEAPDIPPPPIKANQPRRVIAILVDDLGISMESMGPIRSQLRRFIDTQLQPNDLVAIIRTGGEVGALQQFTNDKRLLRKAADSVNWNPCSRGGVSIFRPLVSETLSDLDREALCSDGTLQKTYESLRFVLHALREVEGRKSIVLLSENFTPDLVAQNLPGARMSGQNPMRDLEPKVRSRSPEFYNSSWVRKIADLAIRSSVVIYSVDTRGLVPLGPTAADFPRPNLRASGDQPFERIASQRSFLDASRVDMDHLARETGGFLVRNSNDFGLRRIAEDQSGYYLLGYRPADSTFNRRFHHIKVKVKKGGHGVRTRSGFFGMTDEEARPLQLTEQDRIKLALMSPFGSSDIEVHLTALFADVPNVGPLVRSLVHFSGSGLKFIEEPDGWHKASFNLAAVVFGDNGTVVREMTETRAVRLKPGDLKRVLSDGLVYQVDVAVTKPGTYQFRVAVRDENSSLMGTARELVTVPDLRKDQLALSGITLSGDNVPGSVISEITGTIPGSPAIRRFRQGTNLWFGYSVYNARLDATTGRPVLTAQARIFHDGRVVYASEPKPIDANSQIDLKRITAAGGLRLGSSLEPGKYQFQIVVTESVKPRRSTATQWMDFEIVN